MILFSWEKTRKVWREIFHHFNLKRGIFGTIGSGEILIASLEARKKVVAFGKNAKHIEVVRARLSGTEPCQHFRYDCHFGQCAGSSIQQTLRTMQKQMFSNKVWVSYDWRMFCVVDEKGPQRAKLSILHTNCKETPEKTIETHAF